MSKPVVIGVTIHFRGNSYFAFEFSGDVGDKDAVKEAAWEALNEEQTLAPVEIVEQEYVDDSRNNQKMECWVENGSADDHREPSPKPPTKAQLWRRVARLAGELALPPADSRKPSLCIGGSEWDSAGNCKRLVHQLHECGRLKAAAKLEAALSAWEAAP